ncbi:AraC family transcriptional regulator [Nocardiopsis metallicus]|uniref:AraC-like DNA-binding protein n=1 Tax=Nocardiopsis metallicus TaxID=179819 RepID=A0A840WKM8_9ACTN|nr:AraC family transcriptional regulator [Nocardiopsis metallicus]MBB5492405.1 AraC-like DNA-binding protein [Nocardiopsis metallicus]
MLVTTEFSSGSEPAEHRFDMCRKLMSSAPAPMEVSSEHAADFLLYQRDLHLGPVRVWAMDFSPAVLTRSNRLVEESDPRSYNLCLVRRGGLEAVQGSWSESCGPDDLYSIDSSLPFELRARGAGEHTGEPVSFLGVEVPKRLLDLPPGQMDEFAVRKLSGRRGTGALLDGLIGTLLNDPAPYRPSDGTRLSVVLADLVSALFTQALEADPHAGSGGRRSVLLARVQVFIRHHLADPDLTPDVISAAHHISTGYLHRIFREEGLTVTQWIRGQRLERARRQLEDPASRTTPIHRIASASGFSHPEVFSRAFRREFGASPRQYREDVGFGLQG